MGSYDDDRPPRVRVVGSDSPERRTVVSGVSAFEYETVSSVAAPASTHLSAVVLVAPAVEVPAETGVQRLRRTHGETPILVVADSVPTVLATAVAPVDASAVERAVRAIVDDERIERPRRRLRRIGALVSQFDVDDDAARICEKLTTGVGYESAWFVQIDGGSIRPVAADGIALSALRTVDTDDDVAWARALRTDETVVEPDGSGSIVAVPFQDGCLVCTSSTPVGAAEVESLQYVVSSLVSLDGVVRPRYALLGDAVAHEVNNQLDIALVHLDLLDSQDDHLEFVEAALTRIGEVIEEVNALLSHDVSPATVALGSVSEEVWDAVVNSSATLEVEAVEIEADERLVRLLLSNLFRNAIQHAGDDVIVEVGPLEGGGFYVADDGSGIPEASSGQLFEWGWSEAGGTGIGLALVSLVAERHGWETTVDGDAGARFEFRP